MRRDLVKSAIEKNGCANVIPLYEGYETLGISERSYGIVHDETRQVENYDDDDPFPRFRN